MKKPPIRWTIFKAGAEFGLAFNTVSTRLKKAGIIPGRDRKFSTVQIHTAVCSEYDRQRTRKMTENADAKTGENSRTRKSLVDEGDLLRRMNPIFDRMADVIRGTSMSDAEKELLLGKIASLRTGTKNI